MEEYLIQDLEIIYRHRIQALLETHELVAFPLLLNNFLEICVY